MKWKLHALAMAGIFFAVLFSACKKDNSGSSQPVKDEEAATISKENAVADAEYDDVTEIGYAAGADMETAAENGRVSGASRIKISVEIMIDLQFKLGPCAQVTVSPDDDTYPKTVTINYGTGCLCRDGKVRKGTITLTYSAPLRQPGAELNIVLNNFFVNNVKVEGTATVKNLTAAGVRKYSVTVKDGKVTWPNGRSFTYAGARVVTQTAGNATLTVRDDVYSIEASSEVHYSNGITVTKKTGTPLIKPITCPYLVSGTLITTINSNTFTIDFGTGSCDKKALLITASGQIEITLP